MERRLEIRLCLFACEGPNVYERWVLQLYGADIIRRYGSLALGEKELLPIGLASMLSSEKIRWQKRMSNE